MNPSDVLPLTPADSNLSDFKFMPLEVQRLRKSRAWLICKRRPELAFYMLNLWTASWHEQPAGSLEDDDDVLADLAMCDPAKWMKLRADVLRGWIKCSDGRLYNKTVAEKANESWTSKLEHHYERARERLRKQNKTRTGQNLEPMAEMSFEAWNRSRLESGIPMEKAECSAGIPAPAPAPGAGIPPENALKGEGQGEGKGQGEGQGKGETKNSDPAGPAAGAAGIPAPTAQELTKTELWRAGKSLLAEQGMPIAQCGTFVGKLVKDYGDDIVVEAVRSAVVQRPADVAEWLVKACKARKGVGGGRGPMTDAEREAIAAQTSAEAAKKLGLGGKQVTIDV